MSDRRLYIKNSHYCGRELYHHGILGQKWGVKNGPPYPLDPSDRSAAEKGSEGKKEEKNEPKNKGAGEIGTSETS